MAGRKKGITDTLGRVRLFEVYTPNEKFTGQREKVPFHNGRAELPEPRPSDFFRAEDYQAVIAAAESIEETDIHAREAFYRKYPGLESYLNERSSFRDKVEVYKNKGWKIRVREVEVHSEQPIESVSFEG